MVCAGLWKMFHPAQSWSQKVVHAGFWCFAFHGAEQLLTICRILGLARLLSPKEFGLFGISMTYLSALDIVTTPGIDQALIHRKEADTACLDVAWTVRAIRGIVLAALMFGTAPWVGAFFGEQAVVPLIQVLSISLVSNGFINIGVVVFQKDLDFRRDFIYRFSGIMTDLVVVLISAYLLRNAWAFVFASVSGSLARLCASYWIHPFRPRLRFDRKKLRELLYFGRWMFSVNITDVVSKHITSMVIGKVIGAEALGYFQTASRIVDLVVLRLGANINRVAFPAYTQLQSSGGSLRGAYRKIAGFSATLLIPATAGIICVGHDFTRIFLGPKWIPMVTALFILAVASLLLSVAWTGQPAFMGRGRPKTVFYIQLAVAVTLCCGIYPLSVRWNIQGAALAMVLSSMSGLVVWYANIRRQVGITIRDLGLLLMPPLLASLVMAGAIYLLRTLTVSLLLGHSLWNIPWLVCMILVGAGIYAVIIAAFQWCLPDYRPLGGIAKAIKG